MNSAEIVSCRDDLFIYQVEMTIRAAIISRLILEIQSRNCIVITVDRGWSSFFAFCDA